MPKELSEEELAQREFFAGLQKDEILKRIFQPDFPETARQMCLQCTGEMCNSLFLPYGNIDTETDIDTFIQALMDAFPGSRKLERKGDIIHYDFFPEVRGECMCPIITLGHLEPTGEWCTCGNYFNKAMFEKVVKHPVQVELLDSPLATGSDICRRLIHLKPPALTTGGSQEGMASAPARSPAVAEGAVEQLLAVKKQMEVPRDMTVGEFVDGLEMASSFLLEMKGEVFNPDDIRDTKLSAGDTVTVVPQIIGG